MRTKGLLVLTAMLAATPSTAARAGEDVHVLVLMENGVGSAAAAQPHIDKLLRLAAKANGWSQSAGKYVTSRAAAKRYVDKHKPQYGILSLGAYLALRKPHGLAVVGTADVTRDGGRQYHVVGKAAGLKACKSLASNHAEDAAFIDKVVAGGSFKLGDFKLVKTRRPVQTIKAVIRDKADCALIDNAQLGEITSIEGGNALKTLWSSKQLPPMAVVAFSGTGAASRAKFKASLGSLCTGEGKSTCASVGITSLKGADDSAFKAAVTAYGN